MHIEIDDLSREAVRDLLRAHRQSMLGLSPPESVHASNIDELRGELTFWTAWDGNDLLGCGALKQLTAESGEVKAMRTVPAHLRRGVARKILEAILGEARRRGYRRVSLETGSNDAFLPAQRLYESFGFVYCGPFEGYVEDPHSVFMTLAL